MSDNPDLDAVILGEIKDCILWAASLGGYGWPRRIPWYWSGGVLYKPSEILGHPLTTAERKLWSRTCEQLAAEGQIVRIGNTRTTHLQPTQSTVAGWLADSDEETGRALVRGLKRSLWGLDLVKTLVGDMT